MRWPLFLLFAAAPAFAQRDPRHLLPPAQADYGAEVVCGELNPQALFTLPELVDLALCRNPQTAAAYAAARTAAAQAGQTRASLLPSLSGSLTGSVQRTGTFGSSQSVSLPTSTGLGAGGGLTSFTSFGGTGSQTDLVGTAGLSLSYLLFDFGGRRARNQAADANIASALASFSDSAQGLALQVVQSYNNYFANRAAEQAALASVRFAQTSLESAQAKENIGTGLRSDTLQAQSALAQAELTLQQARGNALTTRGQLAAAITLPPQTPIALAEPQPLGNVALLTQSVDALIAAAERLRPDLAARRASLQAAAASYRAARSDLKPSVSLSAQPSVSVYDSNQNSYGINVGVTLSVPFFDGYGRSYAATAARSTIDQNTALVEQTREQVGLDIWTNYQTLVTQLQQLATSRELLASAAAAADLAQGRFRAGVGTFTDLLNAQSSLANARQQLVSAEFNVRNTQASLARAVGDLDGIRDGRGPR